MAVLKYKDSNGAWTTLSNILVNGINVVQTTGYSTSDVMSQDAVTEELEMVKDDVLYITDTISAMTDEISEMATDISAHTADTSIHVTSNEKATWNAKVDASAIADFFDDAKYEDSGTTKVINFYHGNVIKASIDASDFIVDGMVDDVRIENGNLVIDFNTASGKQDISIPLTDIFDPSNYYTKTEVDARDLWISGTSLNSIVQKGSSGTASGDYSVAEGHQSSGTGSYSHAEGYQTSANGNWGSHAEGYQTKANGTMSHAEGNNTKANGHYGSHAEGSYTVASGMSSHAEGNLTTASGSYSHAEGTETNAYGDNSHAEGRNTSAFTDYSHAEGFSTIANNQSEHASGQYNVSSSASTTFGNSGNTLFSVGNGANDYARHNAFEIRQNGDIYIVSGGTDIKLQDNIGKVETVTAITPSNSGSTDPIATKVVAENELTVSNALNDLNTTITAHTADTNVHFTTNDRLKWETLNRRTRKNFTASGMTYFINTLKSAIADQDLEKYGLKVGDYYTVTHDGKTYNYVIAGLNTMKGTSTPYRLGVNHVGIIVDTNDTHAWNTGGTTTASTNTYSTGGTWTLNTPGPAYANCDLHYYLTTTVLGNVKTDLGSDNIKSHYKLYSTAVNTGGYNRFGSPGGCSSSWAWYANQEICALSEVQVYGSTVWSSSGYDTGEACRQLDVFRVYNMNEIFEGRYPWLRDVASSSDACLVDHIGAASRNPASRAFCVAALILFA